ncbi:hypothetical protein PMZ73_17255 [[Clostridium] symbiosum]|uniref:Uncharacterized protein n=1 Tax=Clostridium symbiosum TaxID=1512 RepID=A0AAW6AWX2_CLOSY|nr:hypothetical protein [[Clostridium] symbiosum]MDB1979122.1 hypothetical protein [[Clostridium] symbiosum]MDB1983888.1 hypothetical protein [[Clostridium] symbiosum]MDB1988255.1 hypothetical protein [[Clostridium] symbiosum]MDB1992875.1 hypothetical protein [[Clostridium] symbiosum]MDB1997122.1 hypothetical protein [[Clostridium] symbiosum]
MNKTVRKENYERGMKYGDEVYCGQDLRDFVGMTIREVNSNDIDANVIIWLENEERSVALYFDDICFDGEHIRTVAHSEDSSSFLLRPVSEKDLKEISEMKGYCDLDVYDDNDEKIGVNHMYCNDIGLEGTEEFKVKRLYVFHDGQIMTQKEVE